MVDRSGVLSRLAAASMLAALIAAGVPSATLAGAGGDTVDTATQITTLPYSATGSTAGSSLQVDEPSPSCVNGTRDRGRWFTLTPSFTGTVRVAATSQDDDPSIAVFRGTSEPVLVEVACNDDVAFRANRYEPRLAFNVVKDEPLHILVATPNDAAFALSLKKVTRPSNDLPGGAIALAQPPSSVSGTTINATWSSSEPSVISCGRMRATVWYRLKPKTSAPLQAWVTNAEFQANVVVLRGTGPSATPVACNRVSYRGDVATYQGRTTWKAKAGVTYLIGVGGTDAESGAFRLNLAKVTRPANDDRANAAVISSLTATFERSTINATFEVGPEVDCAFPWGRIGPTADVWYRWTPTEAQANEWMLATSSMPATGAGSLTAVYEDTGSGPTLIDCDNNPDFVAQSGATYYLRAFVDGTGVTSNKLRTQLRFRDIP